VRKGWIAKFTNSCESSCSPFSDYILVRIFGEYSKQNVRSCILYRTAVPYLQVTDIVYTEVGD